MRSCQRLTKKNFEVLLSDRENDSVKYISRFFDAEWNNSNSVFSPLVCKGLSYV